MDEKLKSYTFTSSFGASGREPNRKPTVAGEYTHGCNIHMDAKI